MLKLAVVAVAIVAVLFAAADARRVHMSDTLKCVRSKTCLGSDWIMGRRTAGDQLLRFGFAVKNKNMNLLDDFLAVRGNGRWMSPDEVRELTVDTTAQETVLEWMRAAGFIDITVLKSGFVLGSTPASNAEKVFQAHFFSFSSKAAGRLIHRASSYSLPEEIAQLVDFVDNTVQFPQTLVSRPIIHSLGAMNVVNTKNTTTLSLIDKTYSISSNTIQNTSATQSLFESLSQSYSPDDLTKFEGLYDIPTEAIAQVIGTNDPHCTVNPNNCAEANLDVQYIIALAQGAPTTFWYIDDSSVTDIFLAWALQVAESDDPPYVHSISYTSYESENEESNIQRTEEELTKLSAEGLTVMVSSGDDGVAGYHSRYGTSFCGFNPNYPCELPHVISVGATMGPEYGAAERACTADAGGVITTGGGFSAVFTAPTWQSSFTAAYIKDGPDMPPSRDYSGGGRGYPDVSMMGHNYMVVIGGLQYEVSGTSASTPVFAGVLSLINGMRLASGKQTLGWITPNLYSLYSSHKAAFNDVTEGTNNCSADADVCCTYGFTATDGWDPVCGLGSIYFPTFSKLLLDL